MMKQKETCNEDTFSWNLCSTSAVMRLLDRAGHNNSGGYIPGGATGATESCSYPAGARQFSSGRFNSGGRKF
jgi:hypothetical protein